MIADITLLPFIRYIQCGTGDSTRHSKVPAKAVTRNKSHSDDNGRKKLSFFAHNTIIHVENPESIKEISLAMLQGG